MSNLLFDYHLHSRHSPDGSMEMDTILKRAQELGLAEICITDHIEVDNSTNSPRGTANRGPSS